MKRFMINAIAIIVIGLGGISLLSPEPAHAASSAKQITTQATCTCSDGSECTGDSCECTSDGCNASGGGTTIIILPLPF